jgi:hypothetical protein
MIKSAVGSGSRQFEMSFSFGGAQQKYRKRSPISYVRASCHICGAGPGTSGCRAAASIPDPVEESGYL